MKRACGLRLALALVLPNVLTSDDVKLESVRIIAENGGRANWDPSGTDRIAFDRKNPDG
jgi:hypothetical protein